MSLRYRTFLRERYLVMLGIAGQIIAIIGVLHLVPLLLIVFYPHEWPLAGGFLLAGLPLITFGLVMRRYLFPAEPIGLTVQDGSVIVVIVWFTAIFSGAIPFMTAHGLNFPQALFESTSGWTTTGLTVVNVEEASRLILFYRGFIQFSGGAGFAILALTAAAGNFGFGLAAAEGRTEQLAPHVRQSANIVLRIYSGYTLFGIIAFKVAGMSWFDAVNHAFAAVATGGFSTRAQSIGYYNSPLIEAIAMILMLLGSINFIIAYTLMQRKVRTVLRSGELRLKAGLLFLATVLMLALVTTRVYPTFAQSTRIALFEIVAAASTTGFSITSGYTQWSDFGWLILILLMLIGGNTGSTAGGIKTLRVYILYKSIVWEIKRAFMPRHMVNEPAIWQAEKRDLLNDRQVRQVALFIGLYMIVFIIGSGLMTAYGYPLRDSMFEFASTISGTGLSAGVTQPNMPTGLLWAQSLGMLMGRLEFFAVIIGVIKLSRDMRDIFSRTEHD